jgi:aldose sugar dehydrogenase
MSTAGVTITILTAIVFMTSINSGYATNNSTRTRIMGSETDTGSVRAEEQEYMWIQGFISFDNQSHLSLYWNDSKGNCFSTFIFQCTINFTTGWEDNSSLQISTRTNNNDTWSWIYGKEIDVNPNERYELDAHMKLNEFATQSHIALEAFNETSGEWYQFEQCPSGTDGPLEWQVSSCEVTIPANTTKIRLVLNAGWSSQQNREAVTFFDAINITSTYGPESTPTIESTPAINDSRLSLEVVFEGLEDPTGLAFLGLNDMLVLEKNKGMVHRIVNGTILEDPLFDAKVVETDGMLGIAIAEGGTTTAGSNNTNVFLYYTEARTEDSSNLTEQLGNRLYRYELIDNKLVNPKLLLDLPVGPIHNAGIVMIGSDNNLYVSSGEIGSVWEGEQTSTPSKAINYENGADPDGRAGILRVTQDGRPVKGILGNTSLLDSYFAYGIRNSFGMDFDPVSGKLWDTENGPQFGDEINLVEPGFNSGWALLQGNSNMSDNPLFDPSILPPDLVDFGGKGKYGPPEFTWNISVGPTALKFFNSSKLGEEYENSMFVADFYGTIYNFKLSNDRARLFLEGQLADGQANHPDELQNITFAQGFSTITDMEVGPDGYLYVVSMDEGRIYRIVPLAESTNVGPTTGRTSSDERENHVNEDQEEVQYKN